MDGCYPGDLRLPWCHTCTPSIASIRLQVCHCDLKPENVLLKERGKTAVKVIDFGSSCYVDKR